MASGGKRRPSSPMQMESPEKQTRTHSIITLDELRSIITTDNSGSLLQHLETNRDIIFSLFEELTGSELCHFLCLITTLICDCKTRTYNTTSAILSSLCFIARLQRLVLMDLSSLDAKSVLSLVQFYRVMFEKFPTKAHEKLYLLYIGTENGLSNHTNREQIFASTELAGELNRLQSSASIDRHQQMELASSTTSTENSDHVFQGYINFFRRQTIYPQRDDLFRSPKDVVLFKNKTHSSYDSADEYLATHFQLLREDFIGPLRSGVKKYRAAKDKAYKQADVRIYKNVRLNALFPGKFGILTEVLFKNEKKWNRVKWRDSRHLIYGSFMLFTGDDFESCYCATVADRNPADLECGKVIVKFMDGVRPDFACEYLMVESTVYFEPYRHFLTRLQRLTADNFPMFRYVVKAEKDANCPIYMHQFRKIKRLFTCIQKGPSNRNTGIYPLDLDDWPSAGDLNLDVSQYEALQKAVTQDIAIIQGPPGTGKTFVGLKIVTLLHNWKVVNGPILIMCNTNHALDQFVEGIASETDAKIVRVGTRSKSAICQEVSLSEKKKDIVNFRIQSAINFRKTLEKDKSEVAGVSRVHTVSDNNDHKTKEILIDENILHNTMSEKSDEQTDTRSLTEKYVEHIETSHKDEPKDIEASQTKVSNDEEMYSMDRESLDTMYTTTENIPKTKESSDKTEHKVNNVASGELVLDKDSRIMEAPQCEESSDKKKVFNDKLIAKDQLVSFEKCSVEIWSSKRSTYGTIKGPWKLRGPRNFPCDLQRTKREYELCQRKAIADYYERIEEYNDSQKIIIEFDQLSLPSYETHIKNIIDNFLSIENWLKPNISDANSSTEKLVYCATAFPNTNEVEEGEISDQNIKKPSKLSDQIAINDIMSQQESLSKEAYEAHSLPHSQRWRLYRYWLTQYKHEIMSVSEDLLSNFDDLSTSCENFRYEDDLQIIKKSDVIAITTTGAARYGRIMEQLNPTVVIVEEAAQVLESHIIAGLSSRCEQLILIGDHKQLKPTISWLPSASKHNLDVSLFERLINNGLPYTTLGVQHRMRPEIADISRLIYDKLADDISVTKFPDVSGVTSNVVFMNHSHLEECGDDSKSYRNPFEVEYITALCRHFMLNGYCSSRITVLSLYTAQLHLLTNSLNRLDRHVRVCNVDNYQGEENDIIVVSIVRSNVEGNVGFVKEENRICVALSRAKQGLYVIGNQSLMSQASPLWERIINLVRIKGQLCDGVTLECQSHNIRHLAKSSEDFEAFPEGGCLTPCFERMPCGHRCESVCHPLSRDHVDVHCNKPCARSCEQGHPCKLPCYARCSLCEESVSVVLPQCGHSIIKKCYQDPNSVECCEPCEKILLCGHVCSNKCGLICKCLCEIKLTSTQICNHTTDECEFCDVLCAIVLPCGHQCRGSCGTCCSGRLHKECKENCTRLLLCGHPCPDKCSTSCGICVKPCENSCVHNKCEKLCGTLCIECKKHCKKKCYHTKCRKACSEICDRVWCNVACPKKFECCELCKSKKQCFGICSEDCLEACLTCQVEKLQKSALSDRYKPGVKYIRLKTCGHIFEIDFLDRLIRLNTEGAIRSPCCPKCNAQITHLSCNRYNGQINSTNQDIQTVKKQILEYESTISCGYPALRQQWIDLEGDLDLIENTFKGVTRKEFVALLSQEAAVSEQVHSENVLQILRVAIVQVRTYLSIPSPMNITSNNYRQHVHQSFLQWFRWLFESKNLNSEVIATSCKRELLRIEHFLQMLELQSRYPYQQEIVGLCQKGLNYLASLRQEYNLVFQVKFEELMNSMNDLISNSPFTLSSNAERVDIKTTFPRSQGYWFKCHNNHIYRLTKCDIVNQSSVCPECRPPIGGLSHQLDLNCTTITDDCKMEH